jgi:hypothetical protein
MEIFLPSAFAQVSINEMWDEVWKTSVHVWQLETAEQAAQAFFIGQRFLSFVSFKTDFTDIADVSLATCTLTHSLWWSTGLWWTSGFYTGFYRVSVEGSCTVSIPLFSHCLNISPAIHSLTVVWGTSPWRQNGFCLDLSLLTSVCTPRISFLKTIPPFILYWLLKRQTGPSVGASTHTDKAFSYGQSRSFSESTFTIPFLSWWPTVIPFFLALKKQPVSAARI